MSFCGRTLLHSNAIDRDLHLTGQEIPSGSAGVPKGGAEENDGSLASSVAPRLW